MYRPTHITIIEQVPFKKAQLHDAIDEARRVSREYARDVYLDWSDVRGAWLIWEEGKDHAAVEVFPDDKYGGTCISNVEPAPAILNL